MLTSEGIRPSSPSGELAAPSNRNKSRPSPNDIERVIDATAELVKRDFEDFLSRY